MPLMDLDTLELEYYHRWAISIYGYVRLGNYDGKTMYAFKCPKHGYVVNHPQGYWNDGSPHQPVYLVNCISELRCPECVKEKTK